MRTHAVLLTLAVTLLSFKCGRADETGFVSLFDGKTLAGWDGAPDRWQVVDGAITGQSTTERPLKSNTFLVWRGADGNASVADFDLQLKIRIQNGNSGIQFRSREVKKHVIAGYQADYDAANQWTGALYDEKGRGLLARRGQRVELEQDTPPRVLGTTAEEAKFLAKFQQGGWNDYRILAEGNHIQLFINGILTADVVDRDAEERDLTGLLALQLHTGPPMTIQFKDIRIRHHNEGDVGAVPKKHVVFVAGMPSHGYGAHEHYAGCVLLAKHLQTAMPSILTRVHRNGWPSDPEAAFRDADVIVMYADGGQKHPVIPHLDAVEELASRGVGIACLHYGVDVPPGVAGESFRRWIGGCFEPHWSVNPHWKADFRELPRHPATRGVLPFQVNDEWYFNMRFRDGMEHVTPLLSAVPPASTMSRRDGAYSGNPHVRKMVAEGQPQHVAWVVERTDGGRGFGFTGGHFHTNWGDEDFRKLVLNALVWLAGEEVPVDGVPTQPVTREQLVENQDYPMP